MKKRNTTVFLCGSHRGNSGPSNVNRYLIENDKNEILYEKSDNFLIKRLERLFYFLLSDVIVFSGFGKYRFWIQYATLLKKKTVYLMHGYANYETKINMLNIDSHLLKFEYIFLKKVDLILTVSECYKEWICEKHPEMKSKIHFLNSGVARCSITSEIEEKNNDNTIRIVVAGGDRPQKNNIQVAKAVEILAERYDRNVELRICGKRYFEENLFEEYPHCTILGLLKQNDFYDELKRADIFVLNSEVESFGLSATDALFCGCNILISKNSGVQSILVPKEEDIIKNMHDPYEIAMKIEKIVNCGNADRLLKSIDIEHYSWENVSKRLYKICCAVHKNESYTHIR